MSSHSPLEQFTIKTIAEFSILGFNIDFTNSALFMCIASTIAILYLYYALKSPEIIPNKLQASAESLYTMICDMLKQNAGEKAVKFIPFIFSLFLFIMFCNLCGLLPFAFTVTSHISVTLILAMMVFLLVTIYGFYNNGIKFASIFLPKGTPLWLAPLMILIELFAYLARPISLSLRLAANMIAGHVLLKVIAGFIVSLFIILKLVPIVFVVILIGFELFVAILQAYIFAVLACVYLNDAINLH